VGRKRERVFEETVELVNIDLLYEFIVRDS
jgi:hypothetical protein